MLSIISGLVLLLSACSTSSYVADDVYYTPGDEARIQRNMAGNNTKIKKNALKKAENSNFSAKSYTEPEKGLSVVSDGDTLSLDSFQYENGDRDVVVNNYYSDYTGRINRFYSPYAGLDYYSPFYSPYSYDPWYYGSSFPLGFNMGLGFGLSYGFGYPNYYYPYSYYGGYYGGYYGDYYGGYNNWYYGGYNAISTGIVNDNRGVNGYYGHRRSSSTARYNPVNRTTAKNVSNYNVTGRRRGGTTSTSTVSPQRTSDAVRKTTNVSSQVAGRRSINTSGETTRAIPHKTQQTNSQVIRRTSGAGRVQTVSRSTAGVKNPANTNRYQPVQKRYTTTRVLPSRSTSTSTVKSPGTQRRYIPRYSNPKTNSKPSYNNSSSKSYNVRSSVTRKPSYSSSPVRRSTYMPVRRSTYSSPVRSSSSGRSYRSSSGGSSRSAGSSVRSSGSTSRSSGSASRSSGGGSSRRK